MQLPREFLDDLIPDVCASLLCRELEEPPPSVLTDSLGLPWCKDCEPRQYLINWGYAHNWPVLEYGNYALAEGMGYWATTALLGDDERVCALMAATEEWDKAA